MNASNFSLQKYFERIKFYGDVRSDIATITSIMRHQLFSVPFENLDVQAGKVVSLIPEEIFEKIVHRNRGGYCYEVNGIFAMALEALGIPYRFIAARPMFYPVRRPKTHMAIVINLEGKDFLCDLGFGSYGIRAPIPLSLANTEIIQDHDTFRLQKTDDQEYLLQALVGNQWTNQYAFDLSRQEWVDFTPANYFNSTHPDTIFVQKLLVVLHNPDGRNILLGDRLKSENQGNVEERLISPEEQNNILKSYFGLSNT